MTALLYLDASCTCFGWSPCASHASTNGSLSHHSTLWYCASPMPADPRPDMLLICTAAYARSKNGWRTTFIRTRFHEATQDATYQYDPQRSIASAKYPHLFLSRWIVGMNLIKQIINDRCKSDHGFVGSGTCPPRARCRILCYRSCSVHHHSRLLSRQIAPTWARSSVSWSFFILSTC